MPGNPTGLLDPQIVSRPPPARLTPLHRRPQFTPVDHSELTFLTVDTRTPDFDGADAGKTAHDVC
ncbi:MAG: hypothetical protein JSU86_11810 [Phycisphaerales bacterium]|nr:MAG: hypothetical protein JSU86_11810 [Phycisphaerales bacterium]